MLRLRTFAALAAWLVAIAAAAPAAHPAVYGINTIASGLNNPAAVAALGDGSVLVAELGAHRVDLVRPDGTMAPFAGTGASGSDGDNGPATSATLTTPRGLAVMADGSVLITDRDAHVVRRVTRDGTITTVAGTANTGGYSGDSGPATAATLKQPYGASPTAGGGFLIADRGNNVIRRVDAGGTITTVAGTGAGGFGGDNGPATAAQLSAPCAVAVLGDGSYLIPDRDNNRVRLVGADGRIVTVSGTGDRASTGDGGPATAAGLSGPYSVAMAPDGGMLIGERDGNRVRAIARDGTISTIAGTGAAGFAGDGGAATAATLNGPVGVALAPDGSILIADTSNGAVRRLVSGFLAPPVVAPAAPGTTAPEGSAPAAARLALRVAALRARAGRRLRVRFVASAPARVTLAVLRGRRTVARATLRARAGANAVTVRRRLRAGRYAVRLRARGADGQVVTVARALVVHR